MIKGQKILITGAAGSVGSELVRQLSLDHTIYGIDINEIGLMDVMEETGISGRVGDIRDDRTMRDVFSDFKPEIVYHAAAYKSVNMMETTPLEAIQTNVLGTYNVIYYAKIYEVKKLIYISSDKVVNAHSVMGQTKKLSETLAINSGFTAVRFGNVLGSRGSVIPIWQKQIEQKRPLTITDPEMTRFFMTLEEACSLVIEAGKQGIGGEIYILDMGEPVKIIELAEQIIKQSRSDTKIEIIGKRPGETMHEKLMTEEEAKIAVRKGRFYVLK